MVNIKHTIFQLSVNMFFFIDSTWHSIMSRTTRLYIFLEMKTINQFRIHLITSPFSYIVFGSLKVVMVCF